MIDHWIKARWDAILLDQQVDTCDYWIGYLRQVIANNLRWGAGNGVVRANRLALDGWLYKRVEARAARAAFRYWSALPGGLQSERSGWIVVAPGLNAVEAARIAHRIRPLGFRYRAVGQTGRGYRLVIH